MEPGFHATVQKHRLRIAQHKMQLWTPERPAMISVAGRKLETVEDLIVPGPSVVAGANGLRSMPKDLALRSSKCLSFGTWWETWPSVVGVGFGATRQRSGRDRQPHDMQCYGSWQA